MLIYLQISLVSNIHLCWHNHSKKRNIHVSSAQDKKACTEKSVGSSQFSMHGKKWLSSVWSHEKRGCLSCERLMSECSKQSSELNFLNWNGLVILSFWPIFFDLSWFQIVIFRKICWFYNILNKYQKLPSKISCFELQEVKISTSAPWILSLCQEIFLMHWRMLS